jgi:acetyl esterase/lipase
MGPLPSLGDSPDVATAQAGLIASAKQRIELGMVPPPDFTGVEKETISIPVRDGSSIPALLYRPTKTPVGGSPLIVLYHGGGWCIGTPEMEEDNCLIFVKLFGAIAISVDYRMAPGYAFPIPIDDSWDALKWVSFLFSIEGYYPANGRNIQFAANPSKLGADPRQGFIVGGTSAGGNIAAVVTVLARDEKLSTPVTGTWLNIPVTIHSDAVPEKYRSEYGSYEQNKDAAILDKKALEWLMSEYGSRYCCI